MSERDELVERVRSAIERAELRPIAWSTAQFVADDFRRWLDAGPLQWPGPPQGRLIPPVAMFLADRRRLAGLEDAE